MKNALQIRMMLRSFTSMARKNDKVFSQFDEGAAWALSWALEVKNPLAKKMRPVGVGKSNPNSRRWHPDDLVRLIELAGAKPHMLWYAIGEELGRTPKACMDRFKLYKQRNRGVV